MAVGGQITQQDQNLWGERGRCFTLSRAVITAINQLDLSLISLLRQDFVQFIKEDSATHPPATTAGRVRSRLII